MLLLKAFLSSPAMTKPFTFLFIVLKKKINKRRTKKGEHSSARLKTFVERNMKNKKGLTHGENRSIYSRGMSVL